MEGELNGFSRQGDTMQPITIINRGRGPELAHIRITVYDIIPYLEAGHAPTYIAAVLNLSTHEVQALMQYLEEHRDEVMARYRINTERVLRGNPPEVEAKRRQSEAKMLAWREERRRRAKEGNSAGDTERH